MTEREQKIVDLFLEGKTIKEISEITERTYDQIKKVKYRFKHLLPGELFVKKRVVNDDFFDTIDSEIKAYLLGFFLADGHIDGSENHNSGNNTMRLGLQQSIDDLEVVELCKKYICPESTMRHSNYQVGAKLRKEQVSLRWTSPHMTNILMNKYKISRRKSLNNTFEFPFHLIPGNLRRHFIRGFFDGDGCIEWAKVMTINNVETYRFNVSFICNSLIFAEQIGQIICSNIPGITPTIRIQIGKTTNWWTLRFNANKIGVMETRIKMYNFFYENSNFYLERKKNKFDSFFEYRAKANDNTLVQCNA